MLEKTAMRDSGDSISIQCKAAPTVANPHAHTCTWSTPDGTVDGVLNCFTNFPEAPEGKMPCFTAHGRWVGDATKG